MLSRQEQYRHRLIIKARYFEPYNEARLAEVRRSFAEHADPKSPEHRALLPYFLTHPGARRFVPAKVSTGRHPYWEACTDSKADPDAELHAGILAFGLSEISSLPAYISWVSGGLTAYGWPDDVAQDFRAFREAGMWVAE